MVTLVWGKNDEVNSLETPAIKTNSLETHAISHKDSNLLKPTADSETAVTHKDLEKSRLLPTKMKNLL